MSNPHTTTNAIKHMEQAGFVERRTDEQDRRVSRVYLTATGRELQGRAQQMWVDFEAQVFAGLDQENRALLWRVLEQVQDNLLHLHGESISEKDRA